MWQGRFRGWISVEQLAQCVVHQDPGQHETRANSCDAAEVRDIVDIGMTDEGYSLWEHHVRTHVRVLGHIGLSACSRLAMLVSCACVLCRFTLLVAWRLSTRRAPGFA